MHDREKQALRLLRDALDTAPAERNSFVSARCGEDSALRARVDALLRGIAESDLHEATIDNADRLRAAPPAGRPDDALIGSLIGGFRVIQRVGRGGMGVVYRGLREGADFTQEVAIKLIRRGFDFDDVQARFLRERRILARLSHPNLARFIDGGMSPEGRPWFALEFVRGDSITRWCDAQRLDPAARVKLFLDVCEAVQHAHTQLVVHRDLKPGNVLVDESGAVRLLDFGVAGLLAGDGDDAARLTTIGQRHALTPEYAAPEQFGGDGGGVAADVYALGVILYELLAGVLPVTLDRHDLAAAGRIVRETPPQPLTQAIARAPQAAVDDVPAAMTQRLAARATTLRAYRATVRGDLTRIVEKALAKEPERRYATVAAFAEDLARWRAGAPVRVSGNRMGYRLGKFVRRHRLTVATAAAALTVIFAFAAFHIGSLHTQLQKTEAQRSRAQASLDFLQTLLASPDPQTEFGPETNLGQFLSAAYHTVESSTGVARDVRNEIGLTIASSMRSIERYDEALTLLKNIEAAPANTPGQWKTRVAAISGIGEIQTLQGEYDAAIATLDRARAVAAKNGVNDALTIANLLSMQSIAYNHLAQWDKSIALIDQAVDIATPIRENQPAVYANLLGFASIPRAYPKTDIATAESLLRKSLAFQQAHGLMNTGLYPNTRGELAQVLIDAGRFEEAEPMLLDVIAQMTQRYGANNRETSFKVSNLALLYLRWNRMDEARRWRDDAGRRMTIALGATHPFMALNWIQSADVAFYAGDADRAAADARKAVSIADAQDRVAFAAKAELYEAHARCLRGDAAGADLLRARLSALGDSFGVRPFDVRLAAAHCFNRLGRGDEALAAIGPFVADLKAGKRISRSDYLLPAISAVEESARTAAEHVRPVD